MPPRFQQRPRNPFSNFGMRQNPYYYSPPRMYQQTPYYQPMRQRGGPFRFSNRYHQPTMNRSGGLLSRLLNRRQTPQPVNPFQFGPITRQTQTQIPTWLNPDSISRFLGQTQQILRTTQQIGGMVQQYGPIVKNLPALWKIYRGLNTDSKKSASEKDEKNKDNKEQNHNRTESQKNDDDIFNDDFFKEDADEKEEKQEKRNSNNEKSKTNQPRLKEKKSIPKIFI